MSDKFALSRIGLQIGLVAVALSTSACVRVDDRMLDQRTAMISGRGTAFDSMGGVTEGLVQRAAEMAAERGYPYFAVMNSADRSSTGSWTSPSTTYGSATGYTNCTGSFCTTNLNGSATTYPGQTIQFDRPGAEMMVRFFREGEVNPNAPGVWSVASVLGRGQVGVASK